MIKDKFLLNSCNEKIYVETYTPNDAKETIIFCHGITGCRKGRTMEDNYFQEIAKKLMDKKYKVVLFDFSGHGESEGNDYDVCLSKSVDELDVVFNNEVIDKDNVSFLTFSYGSAVLCEFLRNNVDIKPNKMVMFSPCLYPLESCFLNSDSIFGKDIVEGYNNGNLQKEGYVVVGAKNFKFGNKMIEECNDFYPNFLSNFSDRILVLSGREDVILNTKYNEEFCLENNIENIYFDASHSLFEKMDDVIDVVVKYFEN